MKKRINYFDVAKGITVLLMVFAHLLPASHVVKIAVYSFHLPLFFIASGMLIKNVNGIEKYDFLTFVQKKVKRLLVPYVLYEILLVLIYAILDRNFSFSSIVSQLISFNTIFSPVSAATWFLLCIFISQILLYISVKLLGNKNIIPAIIIYLLCVNYQLFFPKTIGNIYFVTLFRTGCGFFFTSLGYNSFNIFDKLNYNNKTIALLITTVLMIGYLFICETNGQVDLWGADYGLSPILYTIFGIVGSYILLYLCKLIGSNKYIEFWSINSIAIIGTQKFFKDILVNYLSLNINTIVLFIIIMLAEYIYIYFVNKYVPILNNGRSKK